MKVTYDLRFFGEVADRYLPPDLGKRMGAARRVVARDDSPELEVIERAVEQAEADDGELLLSGWNVRRRYTAEEMRAARFVLLRVDALVEPSGEDGGTAYVEEAACKYCGAGAVQRGALFLRARTLRRPRDFQRTLGGEVVVSKRVAELMSKAHVPPAMFGEVYVRSRSVPTLFPSHSQVLTSASYIKLSVETRFGGHPFDKSHEGLCPLGDTAGSNSLSELSVVPSVDIESTGLLHTDRYIGVRRGLLRPERMMVISQRLYRELSSASVTGCSFERVHEVAS